MLLKANYLKSQNRLISLMRRMFSEHLSTKCTICHFGHEIVGCNPCQYLINPNGLKATNYYQFYCVQPALDLNHKEMQKLYI